MQDVYVKQHRATIADFHRQTQRLRVVRVPTCVPNEFLSAKLKEVDVTVKHIAHEINAADGLMSNVRIATIECKSVDAVPDTLRWGFDGLTGVALLFIKGRPRQDAIVAVLVATRSQNVPAREPMRAP